jgi:hypothetical protein
MTTVFNNIATPDGEPIAGAKVEVALVWDRTSQRVAKDDANSVMLMGRYATVTNSEGHWEVDLVATDDISPAGSAYRVTERTPPGKTPTVYYIEVPVEAATPVDQWAGDLIVDTPSYV